MSLILKYRITELFTAIFGKDAAEKKRQFRIQYEISERTFARDTQVTINDGSHVIPKERLSKYAVFLNTPADSLRHYLHQNISV